ncbi:hypothetical protein XELAEV_18021980mg [Xenopus laevis]|uniref:Uncharacterized protein n=1 Tax=Xenopus laevis TaxID=8355 RepID=A0A974D3W7_XENLA|nr:hypothetical protein XELAEV_18021980mg [Xenopus laevis]
MSVFSVPSRHRKFEVLVMLLCLGLIIFAPLKKTVHNAPQQCLNLRFEFTISCLKYKARQTKCIKRLNKRLRGDHIIKCIFFLSLLLYFFCISGYGSPPSSPSNWEMVHFVFHGYLTRFIPC